MIQKNKLDKVLEKTALYFITDSRLSKKNIFSDVKEAVDSGVKIIQYREKNKSKEEMLIEAKKLLKICKEKNALLIINDFPEIAKKSGADGLHIGQSDKDYKIAREILGDKKIIGISVKNLKQAKKAEKLGADYIGIGPVFDTKTKKDAGKGIGLKELKKIVSEIMIPCVAIGGIKESNIKETTKTKVKAIALISEIAASENIKQKISSLNNKIKSFL